MAETTATVSVEQALEILRAKCTDYHKAWADIATSLNLPLTTPIASYFEQINNDPLHWFNAFPASAISFQALAKPKSALLYLLEKCSEVRNAVGEDYCNELAAKIGEEWKKHGKAIAAARNRFAEADETTSEETEEQDKKKVKLEGDDRRQQQQQQRCERTEFEARYKELSDARDALLQDYGALKAELRATRERMDRLKTVFVELFSLKSPTEIELKLLDNMLYAW